MLFFNYGLCDEEGGRERKEEVGGGLRWPERQWWSGWVVMVAGVGGGSRSKWWCVFSLAEHVYFGMMKTLEYDLALYT